jgi:Protein of unknown function (DUF3145)
VSDSTSITVIIFEAPAASVGPTIDLLNQHLHNNFGLPPGGELTTLTLDETLFAEIDGRAVEELAAALTELGDTFMCFTEPTGEYPGDLHINVPALGLFNSECDGNGNATIPAYRLLELVDAATNLDRLKADLNQRMGRAWSEAIKPLLERGDIRIFDRDGKQIAWDKQ